MAQTSLVPGYLPEHDPNKQIWYTGTYSSMIQIKKFGNRVPTRVWPHITKFGTRVPTRVWPKQLSLVSEYLPRYDPNNQLWYPGTYPSMYPTKHTLMLLQYCTLRTDQIDHDLDHLDINLPLWDVVQDLHSTDPTQETCPTSYRLYGIHKATWSRRYTSEIYLPWKI